MSTKKQMGHLNGDSVLRSSYNPEDASITMSSFITANIGNKIVKNNVNPTTEELSYYNGINLVYTLRLTYVDATKADFVSMERIA
jgi:hypothetical protein